VSKTSVEGLPDQGNNGESGSVIRKEQARRYLSSDVEEHELEGFGAHLDTCAHCRFHLDTEKALSEMLCRSRPLYSVPTALRNRLSAIVRARKP